MGETKEKKPPEGTWARLMYDLRRVERTSQEGIRQGWYDPKSANYRGQRFGFEDVDWGVLRQGSGNAGFVRPDQIAMRDKYLNDAGIKQTSASKAPGRLPPETTRPPLPGRNVGEFWSRGMIDPNNVSGYDPTAAYNEWTKARTQATDRWLGMYGPAAKATTGGQLSAANAKAQAIFLARRSLQGIDASGNPVTKDKAAATDKTKPGKYDWMKGATSIGGYGGRGNPYGLSWENIDRYNKDPGDPGAMNRWGQALGTAAPVNAFGGGGRSRGGKYGYKRLTDQEKYSRNSQLGKLGPTIKRLQAKKRKAAGGGNGGGNAFTPPSDPSGYSNELVNWTW